MLGECVGRVHAVSAVRFYLVRRILPVSGRQNSVDRFQQIKTDGLKKQKRSNSASHSALLGVHATSTSSSASRARRGRSVGVAVTLIRLSGDATRREQTADENSTLLYSSFAHHRLARPIEFRVVDEAAFVE